LAQAQASQERHAPGIHPQHREKDDEWWKQKEKEQHEEWYGGEAWYREEAENQKEYDEYMALSRSHGEKEDYDPNADDKFDVDSGKGFAERVVAPQRSQSAEISEKSETYKGWWGGGPSAASSAVLVPAPPTEPPPPQKESVSSIGTPAHEPTRWSSQAEKDDWQFNNYGYLVRNRFISEGMRVGDVAFTMNSQIKYYITPHQDPESTKVEAEIVQTWFDHEYSGVDSGRKTTKAYLAQFD